MNNDFLYSEFDVDPWIFFFFLELRIFVMMESSNGVCYFVLKMFVMMENTSDV